MNSEFDLRRWRDLEYLGRARRSRYVLAVVSLLLPTGYLYRLLLAGHSGWFVYVAPLILVTEGFLLWAVVWALRPGPVRLRLEPERLVFLYSSGRDLIVARPVAERRMELREHTDADASSGTKILGSPRYVGLGGRAIAIGPDALGALRHWLSRPGLRLEEFRPPGGLAGLVIIRARPE